MNLLLSVLIYTLIIIAVLAVMAGPMALACRISGWFLLLYILELAVLCAVCMPTTIV